MATLKKYDLKGDVVSEVAVEDGLLDIEIPSQLIKDYITALRANLRQWSASTKGRSDVIASNIKPHPQKHTGKARQGELSAPQYRGGGIVFGPKPKFDQHIRINRKERRIAIGSLLSQRIKAEHACVLKVDEKKVSKTKQVVDLLKKLQFLGKRVYIIAESPIQILGKYDGLIRAIRNVPKVEFVYAPHLNGYDLALSQELVILDSAVDEIKAMLNVSKK